VNAREVALALQILAQALFDRQPTEAIHLPLLFDESRGAIWQAQFAKAGFGRYLSGTRSTQSDRVVRIADGAERRRRNGLSVNPPQDSVRVEPQLR
jgi:hypothetical protein